MSNPIFVCDLDGVLLDMESVWLQWLEQRHGVLALNDSIAHWNLDESFGDISLPDLWDYTYSTPLKPTKYAIVFLKAMVDWGVDVHILSARASLSQKDAALRDIEANFRRHIKDVHFVAGDQKALFLKNLASQEKVLGFVDDKWQTALAVGRLELFNTFLLDKPYNQCLDIDVKYHRVRSLLSIHGGGTIYLVKG